MELEPRAGTGRTPESEDREHQRGGWRELLRNRRFLLLQASGALAGAGYAVYSVAVVFLAYGITGNLLIAGAVFFIETGVYTLTFLVAPIVDRARDKRSILLACYPFQALAAGVLAYALRTGTATVPLLLGVSFVVALGWDFVWATFMVAPPILVERRQLYLADSINNIVGAGTQIGGYAGGGLLLFFIGPVGGATAYVAILLAAIMVTVPLSLRIDNPPTTRFWETFRRGWDAFRGEVGRPLRAIATMETYLGFFTTLPALLVTAIAYQRFPNPAGAYGALITAYAVGGSLTGIVVGHYNPRRSVGVILLLCPAVAGVSMLALIPASASAYLVGGVLAVVGAALTVRYTAKYTWVQGTYPPEVLGRLTSNVYLFTGSAASVAVLLVGTLSLHVSLANLLLMDAIGLLGGTVVCLLLPTIRRLAF
ncbi:MAG TPA: MFS transporter [Thermoplasmata archaeon]|nr:MFS transporter [Thermoplasmata archaeon]